MTGKKRTEENGEEEVDGKVKEEMMDGEIKVETVLMMDGEICTGVMKIMKTWDGVTKEKKEAMMAGDNHSFI